MNNKIIYKSPNCGCNIFLSQNLKIKWEKKYQWECYAKITKIDKDFIYILSHNDLKTTVWIKERLQEEGVSISYVRGLFGLLKYMFSYLFSKIKNKLHGQKRDIY